MKATSRIAPAKPGLVIAFRVSWSMMLSPLSQSWVARTKAQSIRWATNPRYTKSCGDTAQLQNGRLDAAGGAQVPRAVPLRIGGVARHHKDGPMAPDKANGGAIPCLSRTGLLSKIVPTAHLASAVHAWRHRNTCRVTAPGAHPDRYSSSSARVAPAKEKGPQGRDPGALLQPHGIEGTSARVKR
jgi:hypothetical protein